MKKLFFLILLCSCGNLSSQVITLSPEADSWISSDPAAVTSNFGTDPNLYTYPWSSMPANRRIVIKFDLSSLLGATISSAYLSFMEIGTFGFNRTLSVHRITTPWLENTVTWNSPWSTVGGDYIVAASGNLNPVWCCFDRDSVDLTAVVQNIANCTYLDYGWLIKDGSEDNSQQYWQFASKEYGTISSRPVLRVTYTPGTACTPPLPIELLSFEANRVGSEMLVKCDWSTATETNNNYFGIERSQDCINFSQIGTMLGSGNSLVTQNYTFYDDKPYYGLSYYRLKQVDFDGSFSYSAIKTAFIGGLEIVNIYPSLTSDYATVIILNSYDTDCRVEIFNNLGQKIYDTNIFIQGNRTEFKISFVQFSSGTYSFRATLPSGEFTQKLYVK